MRNNIYLLLLFCSCSSIKQANENGLLHGDWILQNSKLVNYPIITFNKDSTAVFRSYGDTIYFFKYYLKESTLILQNDFDKNAEGYQILELSKSGLIFKSLRENNEKQYYKRKF